MKASAPLLITLFVLSLGRASAADRLLLIGGGPNPEDSQVSIELNVAWIQELMSHYNFSSERLLFTAGNDNNAIKDISENLTSPEISGTWHPLARLMGQQNDAAVHFRHNNLTSVDGSTHATNFKHTLNSEVASLGKNDSLLVVYQGHGGRNSSNPLENTLKLWGDTPVDALTFNTILSQRRPGTTVRSILPQCFSGGFAHTPEQNAGYASHDRLTCGFYSVPPNRESEGCTRSVDDRDYRDYSSYFFAALTGTTRQGDSARLATKTPTLLDAHHWAYIHAWSSDLPFSSSEHFLQQWVPWYLRWTSIWSVPKNDRYFEIAMKMAQTLDIDFTTFSELSHTSGSAFKRYHQDLEGIDHVLAEISGEKAQLRGKLSKKLEHHFPEVFFPYSNVWLSMKPSQKRRIVNWIESQENYPELVRLQNRIEKLQQQRLDTRRKAAMYFRILHMLKLAIYKEQLFRFGSDSDIRQYQALLRCESWSLPGTLSPKPLHGTPTT